MEIILFTTLFIVGIICGAMGFYFFNSKELIKYLNDKISDSQSRLIRLEEANKFLEKSLSEKKSQINILEKENLFLTNYQGRFEQAEILTTSQKSEIENYKKNLELLSEKVNESVRQSELLRQERNNLLKEKQEWSKDKETILYKLSEELIRKNNEDQARFGENQQDIIKKTTETLFKNFEEVLNKVSSLNDDVKKSNQDIFVTKNALLNPGGAGRTSEITLENILKSSRLKEKLDIQDSGDFILQSHFFSSDGIGKKPDAIVFLPDNHLLIIDSKSSSHFLDFYNAEENKDGRLTKEISAKLKKTMRDHLEDLKKKDYAGSKLDELNLQNFSTTNANPRISTIMFFQTEKMLEIVEELDKNLIEKAAELDIWLVGPVGLRNFLNQARTQINYHRQEKNIEQLKIEIKKLVGSVLSMSQKSREMGRSIYKSMKFYNEFAGSFNKNFLSKINNISKLGIEVDSKTSSERLEKYEIVDGSLDVIEQLSD